MGGGLVYIGAFIVYSNLAYSGARAVLSKRSL